MSGIALYNVLTKLGANPEEAKEALSEVENSKNVATKADLKVGLAEQEAKLIEKISDAKKYNDRMGRRCRYCIISRIICGDCDRC